MKTLKNPFIIIAIVFGLFLLSCLTYAVLYGNINRIANGYTF
jgi:hypothetical protein